MKSELTTWRKEFEEAFKTTGDSFERLIIAIEPGGLDKEFDSGYGSTNGSCFTAWSDNYVYFPACYDGAEWIEYVFRNPCNQVTAHIGVG
jgi:hypothetical protein